MTLHLARTLQPRRVLLVVTLAIAALGGCGDSCCTGDPLVGNNKQVCVLDAQCDSGDVYRYGTCDFGGCETDADCCPGERCRADINACFPILLDAELACETSADCPDAAQSCANVSIGGRDPLPTCVYDSCVGDADCGFGLSCFAGHCVAGTPCDGGCPTGSICDVATNSCHELPLDREGAVDDSCKAACDNGLLVVTDEASMTGEVCCAIECTCKPLPPLVPTRFGRYARVAVSNGEPVVSSYDAEFGDLVLAHFKADGSFTRLDFVDGVPADGTATADPLGPRGGVREPGPNVGTHTSIAVDGAGLVRIAFHDVDNKALKVALQGNPGFTTQTVDVDGSGGVIGQFSDIAVSSSGTIFVSYLVHNATVRGVNGPATGLRLARSRNATPNGPSDWDFVDVDVRAMIDATNLRPESPELPRARGLHSSIVLDGNDALIAYYDAIDGDVRVARVTGTTATVFVVDGDGQGGHVAGDVGRFPTLGLVNNDLIVAYEDPTRHDVRFWRGAKATPGTGGSYGVIDRGITGTPREPGKNFVGAGARLSTSGGTPVLTFQDASDLNLKLATLSGATWSVSDVLTAGANGFYSDVEVQGGNAFICSLVAELDGRGKERSRLRLDVKPLP